MKEIKCIAIDDEPLALTVIENFCRRRGGMKLTCCNEPGLGLGIIRSSMPDSPSTGLTLMRRIFFTSLFHTKDLKKQSTRPCEYLKPAAKTWSSRSSRNIIMCWSQFPTSYIYEAMENYIKIKKRDGECIVSRVSMKNILEKLPAGRFSRIHKSYAANLSCIVSFTKEYVIMENGEKIPVGRKFFSELAELQ